MRIVIDLQSAQGSSRHRGIGRYSMSLALAMVRNSGKHEVLIALNGMFPDSIESIRAAFDGLLPQENIRVWNATAPVAPTVTANAWRRRTAEVLRETFLISLEPDIVHITSLFEGFEDDAVHSIGLTSKSMGVAVTFYDLIPLMQSDVYLKPNPIYEKFYLEQLQYLKTADLFLAISEFSRQEAITQLNLAEKQVVNISAAADENFKKIQIPKNIEKSLRDKFGLSRRYVMYSGATDERKNHLRLIKAFSLLSSDLKNGHQLAIVGHLPSEHREKFDRYAKLCGLKSSDVVITGRVSDDEMVQLYNLCDLYVFPSLYEGFGLPVLEAMSCGAAVIGANTSSLPEVIECDVALFNPLNEKEISQKISAVLTDRNLHAELSRHGLIQAKKFSWDESAKRSIAAFENWDADKNNCRNQTKYKQFLGSSTDWIVNVVARESRLAANESDWIATAQAVSQNHPASTEKQLLLDISELVHRDHKTGIQRVVRSILAELLSNPPQGYRVEPVYAIQHQLGYRYAKKFCQEFAGQSGQTSSDAPIDIANGDIFLGLDLQHHVVLQQAAVYDNLKRFGVRVYFVVYDLLPLLLPKAFPEGTADIHARWLDQLARTDGVLCISKAVADEFMGWMVISGPHRLRPLKIGWFHLGADVAGSVPSKGLPNNFDRVLSQLRSRKTFLSVGTIEPRKGQLQTLLAFDQLWRDGADVNLVLVGKYGWNVDLLVEMLRNHSERNRRLFWLEGISDEYLEKVYAASSCLIAASEGEGFGLPLIEAAQHRLPIIARNIPVFQEVAANSAFYFSGPTPEALASCVQKWLLLDQSKATPKSDAMLWLTWSQSCQNLIDVMIGNNWYRFWTPDNGQRFWADDLRLGCQVGKRTARSATSTGQAGYLLFGPYVSLEAGEYSFTVRGAIGQNGVGQAHVDVIADKGTKTLGISQLSGVVTNGCIATLRCTLDSPCKDLEVRVWVDEVSDLEVTMIEILPVAGEQNIEKVNLIGQTEAVEALAFQALVSSSGNESKSHLLPSSAYVPNLIELTPSLGKSETSYKLIKAGRKKARRS